MSWPGSNLARVWGSISRHGIRAGLEDVVVRWGQSRSRVPHNVLDDYGWILDQDRPATLPAPDSGPLKINWLIPDPGSSSGGLRTLFRIIHQMELWGHEHRVYVVGQTTTRPSQLTDFVRHNYFPIRAQIEPFSGGVADSDALVATLWKTAYTARSITNTARKFYLVQDLEHLFYPAGSLSELAKQTYSWGFYGITLGQWIADVLQGEFGMPCSAVGFSYDRDVYWLERNHVSRKKNRVLLYSRPQTDRRGFELGVLALSLVARKMPDTEFVLVGFPPRSLQLPFTAICPGILSPAELGVLYRRCTAALVLSLTNLSLLPLELMACGCAIVSNSGPNVEWLLSDESAQLASPTPEALANAILALMNNEQLRQRKVEAGLAFTQRTDWSSEIRGVESAFYHGLGCSSVKQSQAVLY